MDVILVFIGFLFDLVIGVIFEFVDDYYVIVFYNVVKKGVFVFLVGGNDGFMVVIIIYVVFWMMIVGVFIMDCDIVVSVVFGNGEVLFGWLIYDGKGLLIKDN